MPSLITHNIFAKKEYTRCSDKCTFLKSNLSVYCLGNQGVEPFSFSDYLFDFSSDISLSREKIEKKIKKEDFSTFLINFNNVISSYDEGEKKEIGYSFYLGILLNYLLERNMQPFIYYRSGFRNDGSMLNIDIQNHRRYETMIDYYFLRSNSGSSEKETQSACFSIENNKLKVVSEILYEVIIRTYPSSSVRKESYEKCVKSYTHYLKMIDKTFSRTLLFGAGFRYTDVASDMLPKKLVSSDKIDYLNLKKDVWNNPVSFEESTSSFNDIFAKCIEEGNEIFTLCYDSYKGKNVTKKLEKFIGDTNFEGFVPGKKMMYQKPVMKGEK